MITFILLVAVAFVLLLFGMLLGHLKMADNAFDNSSETTHFIEASTFSRDRQKIKVVDSEWFEKHCEDYRLYLQSKPHWKNKTTVYGTPIGSDPTRSSGFVIPRP